MSTRPTTAGKLPLTDLAEMKKRGERIVMVTAYDYPSGRLADDAGIDVVLVGETLVRGGDPAGAVAGLVAAGATEATR